MGDFSVLKDIPEMYKHCKATEDNEMTPLDFLTDHLVNCDALFDKHDHGDRQKSHQPLQNHHNIQVPLFSLTCFQFSLQHISTLAVNTTTMADLFFSSAYLASVFRPPIFAC